LNHENLVKVLERALSLPEHGLSSDSPEEVEEGVLSALAKAADGDARRALGLLEQAAAHAERAASPLTLGLALEALSAPALRHDKSGDAHYDVVSAFIKSLRGSDPDAALYYMARLIEAGDDPLFICRRMVIFASEDIGNADPRALGVAVDAMQATRMIGMPEARITLAQACTYLATAPKSNAAYQGINEALAALRDTGSLSVPPHIRNAPTELMKEMGHGAGYRYPHDEGGWVPHHYLPEALQGRTFYAPKDAGYERHIAERLLSWRKRRAQGKDES